MITIRPTLFLVGLVIATVAGWYARGLVDPEEIVRRYAVSTPGPVSVRERIVRDTVLQVVRRTHVRIEQVPAKLRWTRDTIISTRPFQARLDTALGSDTLHLAFNYPPALFSFIELRRGPDTTRSILERQEIDRIVVERPRFLERVGGGAVRGWTVSSVGYAIDRSRGGSGGLSYVEAAGLGTLTGAIVDTVMHLAGW